MKAESADKTGLPRISRPSCLRMRFSSSRCSRCLAVCPHNAITLVGGLTIDNSLCSGCQLCSAACPSSALEPDVSLPAVLKAIQRQTPIVIACQKAPQECHLRTACLGFISKELLLAFSLAEFAGVNLNLANCSECDNGMIVDHLKKYLAEVGLVDSEKIKLVECEQELVYQEEALDRRGFFRSLTRTIVSEAASLLAATVDEADKNVAYAEKQLPLARAVLKAVLERRPPEEHDRLMALFSSQLLRGESCDGCRACVKVCPTGALLENYDETQPPFEFVAANCTACGLCVEFCLNEALSMVDKKI